MQTCFLTGCTGQDGSFLSKLLLDKGFIVIGMVRRVSSPINWRWKELGIENHPNFITVSGDLSDQSSIDSIMREYRPDYVYSLAAQSFVGNSWSLCESTLDITGLGAVRVFEAARKFCPGAKIYQASSSEIYGNINQDNILNEQSLMSAVSPYGAAKLLAHNMANIYRESYNMFISCGILFNHSSCLRGEEFVSRKISKGIAAIKLGLSDSLSLGNLQAKRDEGHAEDYVHAMYLIMQHHTSENFVIATGKSYSIFDFVKEALSCVGIEPNHKNFDKYIKIDDKFKRPNELHALCGDASKAKRLLNWQPTRQFKDIIAEMVQKDIERLI